MHIVIDAQQVIRIEAQETAMRQEHDLHSACFEVASYRSSSVNWALVRDAIFVLPEIPLSLKRIDTAC